jgi:hypothetical protein
MAAWIPLAGARRRRFFAACLLAPVLGIAPAAAQELPSPTLSIPRTSKSDFDWGFSTGFDLTTGKYGAKCGASIHAITCTTTGTTVFALPMTGMLQLGRLRLELTVPFVDIQGPGRFAGNLGIPVIVAPATTDPRSRSGLGDATIGAAWLIFREDNFLPSLEIAGVTKLPTAGSGLGTGKTDYGAQVNLYRTLAPGLTAFGSLGYLWVGDINTVQLHSGAHATAGADFKILSFGGGAMVDLQQSTWQGAPTQATLNPYLTWHMLGGLGVTLYTTVGMTRASPSRGVGFRLAL